MMTSHAMTSRKRHPIITAVLAASLVGGLLAPPAAAEPRGPRFTREDGDHPGRGQAYGRADRGRDGAWEVVSSGQ